MKHQRTVPRALWRHYPQEEFNTSKFIDATVAFQNEHRFDWIKVTPRSAFCLRDYGCDDRFEGDYLGRPVYHGSRITDGASWRRISALEPRRGFLGQQLDCLQGISERLGHATPIIQTIFSPLTQAKFLCQPRSLLQHAQGNLRDLMYGLEVLTESTVRFVQEMNAYTDGIYYVVAEAGEPGVRELNYSFLNDEFNRRVLAAFQGPIKVLHLHGPVLEFGHYCSYPVNHLHWSESQVGVPLEEGKKLFSGVVCGGVNWPMNGWRDPAELEANCQALLARVGEERFLMSGDCVIPYQTPTAMINAFRDIRFHGGSDSLVSLA